MKPSTLICVVLSLAAAHAVPHNNGYHPPNFNFPSFSDFSNIFNNNQFPFGNYHHQTHDHDGYGPHSHRPVHRHPKTVCPEQVPLTEIAGYSTDLTDYPVGEITSELSLPARADLFRCLSAMVVLPDAPTAPEDYVLGNSTGECKFEVFNLASFPKYGGKCWVLQNFQEKVLYAECTKLNEMCHNCSRNEYGYGYGFGHSKKSVSRCIQTYKYDSVWTYCEGKPVDERVGIERIAIPTACTCRKVKCETTYVYHK